MYNTHFHGREPIKKPECPFCGSLLIERPTELTTRRPGDMPVGSCSCGAVYACDESGRNMGSALTGVRMQHGLGSGMGTGSGGRLPMGSHR
ncbi:MAG: hypothetical protein JRF34_10435 [Deltaproteobacteria bacterium]|nr:hypothetical protein [Deltaproteobacteria bacterium]